jgi:16S rRNA processing protein RimM
VGTSEEPASEDRASAATAPDTPETPLLHAGRIGKPHGLDGSFYVTRPRAALLEAGRELIVADRRERIERRAGTEAHPILRFAGWHDRAAVEARRGTDLLVPQDEAPPLEPDEWWPEQLEGCRVHDGAQEIGVVRTLMALPSCEVLEVACVDGPDLLVPLIQDAVREVDVDGRRIEIDLAFLGEHDEA